MTWSGCCGGLTDEVRERWERCGTWHAQPVSEVAVERDAELAAGLHEAEQDVAGGPPVLAHGATGDLALGDAGDAEAAGADGLLLAPVSYTPLTEEEVFEHFVAVAGTTKLPLCIYNNPSTTHFTFTDALVARLSAVPGIMAVKNPAPQPAEARSRYEALRARVPGTFAIGYSGDWHSADAVLAGGDAWYSVVGGLLPVPALRLLHAAQAGDAADVARWNARFQGLWDLFKELSSLRVMYGAAEILGICRAAPPRPILSLAADTHRRVIAALQALDADKP